MAADSMRGNLEIAKGCFYINHSLLHVLEMLFVDGSESLLKN